MAAQPQDGLLVGDDGRARCWWHGGIPEYLRYHDEEWGQPVTDDRRLFEKICLEGFQAGLSWLTILRKRENFRRAFDQFDIDRIARYDADDIERLLADAGIIRHRQKIVSTINNAARALELRAEFGSLAAYFWSFEPGGISRT
jgi:DNA-3-methyladenine glycosylase I